MASMDPTVCHCRNQCNRASGSKTEACPCLVNGTYCSSICQCGHGKVQCINRLGRGGVLDKEYEDTDSEHDYYEWEVEEEGLIVAFGDDLPITVFPKLNQNLQSAAEDASENSMENDEDSACQTNAEVSLKTTTGVNSVQAQRNVGSMPMTSAISTTNIEHLSHQPLKEILQQALRLYPDLIRVVIDPEPEPTPKELLPSWCNCGRCEHMPTPEEGLCSKKGLKPGPCITVTSAGPINELVLSRRALELAVAYRNDIFVLNNECNNNDTLRQMAYRHYVLWHLGYLGSGNRVVIPSCVVWKVRHSYPSSDGLYTEFTRPNRLI